MLTHEEDIRVCADRMHRRDREEGVVEGEQRMVALVARLLESDRGEDALATASDPMHRAELFEEVCL